MKEYYKSKGDVNYEQFSVNMGNNERYYDRVTCDDISPSQRRDNERTN